MKLKVAISTLILSILFSQITFALPGDNPKAKDGDLVFDYPILAHGRNLATTGDFITEESGAAVLEGHVTGQDRDANVTRPMRRLNITDNNGDIPDQYKAPTPQKRSGQIHHVTPLRMGQDFTAATAMNDMIDATQKGPGYTNLLTAYDVAPGVGAATQGVMAVTQMLTTNQYHALNNFRADLSDR